MTTQTTTTLAETFFSLAKAARSAANEMPLGSDDATTLYRHAAEMLAKGLAEVEVGDKVDYDEYTPALTVASKRPTGSRTESVVLTQDGKPVDVTDWHKGQEGAWVYYERWNGAKCEAHGYVDSVSRKLLQTG